MKKIFNLIVTLAALIVIAPVAKAQDYIDTGNGIAYSKTISKPDNNGVYTITLESFVTGSVKVTNKSVPVDLILVLDVSSSMTDPYGSTTRIQALKDACRAFIKSIYENDANARAIDSNYAGNRIAIIPYAKNLLTTTQFTQVNTGAAIDAGRAQGSSSLYAAIYNLSTTQGTRPDKGLAEAHQYLQSLNDDSTRNGSTRVVVLFTDGCPSESGSYSFTCEFAASTVNDSYDIKITDKAKLYTIGLFNTSATQWSTVRDYVLDYMNYASSNFPDANATYTETGGSGGGGGSNAARIVGTITYSGIGDGRTSQNYSTDGSSGFFRMASDDPSSLSEIFTSIADSEGGSAIAADENSITEIDIVSASFTLPKGATEADIKVYTAPCIGKEGDYLKFGPDTLAPNRKDVYEKLDANNKGTGEFYDIDNSIEVELSSSIAGSTKNDLIEAKNFDYASNWCGPVTNGGITTYHGNKLILKIPVKMDSTAVGGPNVATNAKGSGIYINGVNQVEFESPTVSLPINIFINKIGLDVGESSKFTIERAILPDDWVKPEKSTDAAYDALDWEPVTSVFVTRHKGQGITDPITKVMGLPSVNSSEEEFVYRVVEDNWSWSYNIVPNDRNTTDQLETNPFKFYNEKKVDIDTKVRHAESKATNTFVTGDGDKYDDSKDNGRTVITVTTGNAE